MSQPVQEIRDARSANARAAVATFAFLALVLLYHVAFLPLR